MVPVATPSPPQVQTELSSFAGFLLQKDLALLLSLAGSLERSGVVSGSVMVFQEEIRRDRGLNYLMPSSPRTSGAWPGFASLRSEAAGSSGVRSASVRLV